MKGALNTKIHGNSDNNRSQRNKHAEGNNWKMKAEAEIVGSKKGKVVERRGKGKWGGGLWSDMRAPRESLGDPALADTAHLILLPDSGEGILKTILKKGICKFI